MTWFSSVTALPALSETGLTPDKPSLTIKNCFFKSEAAHPIAHSTDSDILQMDFFQLGSAFIEMIITFSDTIEGKIRYQRIVISHKKSINGGVVITGGAISLEIWATELSVELGKRLLGRYKQMDEGREMPELYPIG